MAQVSININIITTQPTFKYTIDQLLEVKKIVNNDVHPRRLHPKTCIAIWKLRLTSWGRSGGVKNCTIPSGCNQKLVKSTIKNDHTFIN